MAYHRSKTTIDLNRASLSTLEKHLGEAYAKVAAYESSLTERQAQLRAAPAELRTISQRLAEIDNSLSLVWGKRQPKQGLMGQLFGATELPAWTKTRIASLQSEKSELQRRQNHLQGLAVHVRVTEGAISEARSWLAKLRAATDRKLKKRDTVVELRASAAKNAKETRDVGFTVRHSLTRQPWCPYCGGELGTSPHADHIYPVAKGGRSVPKNMVLVCATCNIMKRDLTLAAFIRKFSLDREAIERRLQTLHKDF